MAITSLDQIIAGMQPPEDFLKIGATMEAIGVHYSPFYVTGRPGAAVAPTPGINGAALIAYSGQIPFRNPVSNNSYLARFVGSCSLPGTLLLCDRLWHNSGMTLTQTTEQAITHPGLPARCPPAVGSTPDASGNNILCGIEVSTATTNASAITNTTLNYTNQDSTTGKVGTIASFPATALVGTFVPFQLATGDKGIRTIEGITLGTSYQPSGSPAIHLVQYRILARLGIIDTSIGAAIDAVGGGFPRLYDNTVPFLLWLPSATTAVNIHGQMIVSQG
jgi:hypothetical protein